MIIFSKKFQVDIPETILDMESEIVQTIMKTLERLENGEQSAIVLPKDWKFSHR